ncbi:MAG: beta-eliminating lyase-related protein [Pseudomonadota bacterium]
MNFLSDNAGPAHPAVLEALVRANDGYARAYGTDDLTEAARDKLRQVFEAPDARVEFTASGTAANAMLLAELTPPWGTVFATPTAHIEEDECGAIPFMTGGAKITLVDGPDGKMDPAALEAALARYGGPDVHGLARGPVSLTQATEKGTLYTPAEIKAHAQIAHRAGVALHMDGARFANAVAATGASPAELTWRAGVNALSLGATKNGALGLEAMVVFDPDRAPTLARRQMRAGHLLSKHRYLAAQMLAWLDDDLWLDLATRANTACARLAQGLGDKPDVALQYAPAVNIVFADVPVALHRQLQVAGARYTVWAGDPDGPDDAALTIRLVCDWSIDPAAVDRFLALF